MGCVATAIPHPPPHHSRPRPALCSQVTYTYRASVPVYRTDVTLVVALTGRPALPTAATFEMDAQGGAVDLVGAATSGVVRPPSTDVTRVYTRDGVALRKGETYAVCVRVYSRAGVRSAPLCSSGVTIGVALAPLSLLEPTNVFLSADLQLVEEPVPSPDPASPASPGGPVTRRLAAAAARTRRRAQASVAAPGETTSSETFVMVSVPTALAGGANGTVRAVRGAEFFVADYGDGEEGSGVVAPPAGDVPTVSPSTVGHMWYGGKMFSVAVVGMPLGGTVDTPVSSAVLYPSTGSAQADASRAPLLLFYSSGAWTSGAGTCATPFARYDTVTRVLETSVCRFGVYGLFFQRPPVAVIDGPAVVEAAPPGDAAGARATFSGAGSYDPDGTGAVVSFVWTVWRVAAPVNVSVTTVTGADSSTLAVTGLVPGAYAVSLTVRDADGGEATTVVPVVVNRPPVAALTATLLPDGRGASLNATGSSDPEDAAPLLLYTWFYAADPTASGLQPPASAFAPVAGNADAPVVEGVADVPGLFTASRFRSFGTLWFRVLVTDTSGGVATAVGSVTTVLAVTAGRDVVLPPGARNATVNASASAVGLDATSVASAAWSVVAGPGVSLVAAPAGWVPGTATQPPAYTSSALVTLPLALGSGWSTLAWRVTFTDGAVVDAGVRVRVNAAPVVAVTVGGGGPLAPGSLTTLTVPNAVLVLSAAGSTDDSSIATVTYSLTPTGCGVGSSAPSQCPPPVTVTRGVVGAWSSATATAWATPLSIALTVPGPYALTVSVADADGEVTVWTGRVALVWPSLTPTLAFFDAAGALLPAPGGMVVLSGAASQLQVSLGAVVGAGTPAARLYVPSNGSDPLQPWLWGLNTTTWTVTDASRQASGSGAGCRGTSSVCWLRGVFAPGDLQLAATVALPGSPPVSVAAVVRRLNAAPVLVVADNARVRVAGVPVLQLPGSVEVVFNASASYDPNVPWETRGTSPGFTPTWATPDCPRCAVRALNRNATVVAVTVPLLPATFIARVHLTLRDIQGAETSAVFPVVANVPPVPALSVTCGGDDRLLLDSTGSTDGPVRLEDLAPPTDPDAVPDPHLRFTWAVVPGATEGNASAVAAAVVTASAQAVGLGTVALPRDPSNTRRYTVNVTNAFGASASATASLSVRTTVEAGVGEVVLPAGDNLSSLVLNLTARFSCPMAVSSVLPSVTLSGGAPAEAVAVPSPAHAVAAAEHLVGVVVSGVTPTPEGVWHVVAVTVHAAGWGATSQTAVVRVRVNRAPVVAVTVAAVASGAGGGLLLDASGTADPDGDAALAFAWVFVPDGARVGGSAACDASPPALVPVDVSQRAMRMTGAAPQCVYLFAVTVTDSRGAVTTSNVTAGLRAVLALGPLVHPVRRGRSSDTDVEVPFSETGSHSVPLHLTTLLPVAAGAAEVAVTFVPPPAYPDLLVTVTRGAGPAVAALTPLALNVSGAKPPEWYAVTVRVDLAGWQPLALQLRLRAVSEVTALFAYRGSAPEPSASKGVAVPYSTVSFSDPDGMPDGARPEWSLATRNCSERSPLRGLWLPCPAQATTQTFPSVEGQFSYDYATPGTYDVYAMAEDGEQPWVAHAGAGSHELGVGVGGGGGYVDVGSAAKSGCEAGTMREA
jgi:hypothetical protein